MVKKLEGWTVTKQATPSWVEEKSVELRKSSHGIVKAMTAILTRTPRRRHAGKLEVAITAIAICGLPHGMGKDARIRKIGKLDDTTSRILEDQAIFDNDLKTI